MVGRIRTKQRVARVRQIGGSVAAVALIAVVLVSGRSLIRNVTHEYYYGGIACSQVKPLLIAYHNGKLPAPLAEKIRCHLAACPVCGPKYKEMFRQVARSASVWTRHDQWAHRVARFSDPGAASRVLRAAFPLQAAGGGDGLASESRPHAFLASWREEQPGAFALPREGCRGDALVIAVPSVGGLRG